MREWIKPLVHPNLGMVLPFLFLHSTVAAIFLHTVPLVLPLSLNGGEMSL